MDDRVASVACAFRVAQHPDGPSGPAIVATIETRGSSSASQSTAGPTTAQETAKHRTFNSSGQYADHAAYQLLRQHREVRHQIYLVQYFQFAKHARPFKVDRSYSTIVASRGAPRARLRSAFF